MVASLEFRGVAKSFPQRRGEALLAVADLTFTVPAGQFIAVVGPSGCGKSTILNMVSGLDAPTRGDIRLDAAVVRGPSPRVAFMLQKDLLLPWRSIVQNVEFGMEARGVPAGERRRRALEELQRVRLDGFAGHYPYQLSGGMRQRAALARTLVVRPDLILLDEPFSALDAQTKLLLQRGFAETIAADGVTTVLITHDLQEAVLMADRILVMSDRPGRITEDFLLDLPDRRDPMARYGDPRVRGYVERLFAALHMHERAA